MNDSIDWQSKLKLLIENSDKWDFAVIANNPSIYDHFKDILDDKKCIYSMEDLQIQELSDKIKEITL